MEHVAQQRTAIPRKSGCGIRRGVEGFTILGFIFGLYWDNGKENGNYYLGFRV